MKTQLTRGLFLLLALAVVGLMAAGCYTVLVHPTVETSAETESARTCSDCHASSDYYYWHYPHQYDWYSGHSSWSRYYYDPWWWDNYWYWDDRHGHGHGHGDGGGGSAPAGHLWQPRVAPGGGTGDQPALAPGSSSNSKGDSKASDKGSGSSGTTTETKQKQELWQPRVPPKNTDDSKSDNSGQTDKGDTQPQEQSEDN